MFKLVVWMIVHVPGPLFAVQDSNGIAHDVQMDTTNYKVEIRGFSSLADCQAFALPQGWTFTDGNGVVTSMAVDTNPSVPPRCVRQF